MLKQLDIIVAAYSLVKGVFNCPPGKVGGVDDTFM